MDLQSLCSLVNLLDFLFLTPTGICSDNLDTQGKTFQSEMLRLQSLANEAKEIAVMVSGLNKVINTTPVVLAINPVVLDTTPVV